MQNIPPMMSSGPLVSIITINFNNLQITLELLQSIEECIYKNLQVIVVDNGSIEDPTDDISKSFPKVTVIRSDKNLGYSAGNNLGSKSAKGEYLFYVNNDTLFAENLVEELLKPFEEHNDVGIVSPKIIYYESPNIIQYAGNTDINPLTGRNKVIGQGKIDNDELYGSGYTFFAHGSAMIIKRNIFNLNSGFPEIFFLYYEEMDYSLRMRRLGYNIFFNNKAVIYHRVSYSTGEDSSLKKYYMTRNRIMFMQRNFNSFQFFAFILFFSFFTIPKNTLKYLFKVRLDLLAAFYKAIKWNIVTSRKVKLNC